MIAHLLQTLQDLRLEGCVPTGIKAGERAYSAIRCSVRPPAHTVECVPDAPESEHRLFGLPFRCSPDVPPDAFLIVYERDR